MPKHQGMIERLTRQLGKKGLPNAREEAVAHLQKSGILRKGTETLTKKGEERTKMGPAGRAIDRASKLSGRPARDYKYIPGRGAILK